jgi:two-component system chemotaxis response regulator CheB
MPVMDGLELTREVMARFPCPILVVSAVVGDEHPERVFALLEAGAVDVFPKPRGALETGSPEARELVRKIKVAAGVFVFPRRRPAAATAANGAPAAPAVRPPGASPAVAPILTPSHRLVAIGASTGGPQALMTILSRLPAAFPVPVLCVQHISAGFLKGLVEWLAGQCRVKVRIARDGEPPLPGHVYFPEEDTHLVLDEKGCLAHSHAPPLGGHRPAVSATFESVAKSHGARAVAVLLTGMGRDGVTGMQAVARAGGVTIAQDEASSVVFGMPRNAIEAGAARHVLSPEAIARALAGEVG